MATSEPQSCQYAVFNRWITLLAGLCMTLMAGTPFLISIYLPYVQDHLKFASERQSDLVATSMNVANSLTIIPGFFFDRFGPRPTAIAAGVFFFCGYFGIYLALTGAFAANYIIIAIFAALIGIGSGSSFTSAVAPNIHNFSIHSGKVVGALAGLYGLSGAIFTETYEIFFKPNIPTFMFFLALSLGAIGIFIGGIYINYVPTSRSSSSTVSSRRGSQKYGSTNPEEIADLLPASSSYSSLNQFPEDMSPSSSRSRASSYLAGKVPTTTGELVVELDKSQFTPLQMLCTIEFYLFFVVVIMGASSQFLLMNNLGSIIQSLIQQDSHDFVTVASITNFFGTIAGGAVSDALSRKLHRPVFTVISVAILGASLSTIALGGTSHFAIYVGVGLNGVGSGVFWSTLPSITHELFGNKHWGFNYGLLNLGPAVGSYLFATLLSSKVYESNVIPGEKKCYGVKCFRWTFFITSACCAFAVFLGIFLIIRTREKYREKQFKKDIVDRLVN